MKHSGVVAIVVSLLLQPNSWPSAADAAVSPLRSGVPALGARSALQQVEFRYDDPPGQLIAKKLLARQIAESEKASSRPPIFRTAWVKTSGSRPPALFVLYGCSPVGNCDLYGFERSARDWRPILDSIAQTCSVMSSSHEGRRDLSARMHGSATESTVKTYWWRKNRYVRVSVREVTFAP